MDRLSSLPDEILHLILSKLPIITQVETSLLSRGWRKLWSLNPAFCLHDWPRRLCREDKSSSVFSQLLCRWQAPQITEIRANFAKMNVGLCDIVLGREWIQLAASPSLRRLVLEYRSDGEYRDGHGPPFCRYLENGQGLPFLEELYLTQMSLTFVPPFARYIRSGFPSLKAVHLKRVNLTDSDLGSLLLASPLLESLKIELCNNLNKMAISSSSLKVLEVDCCSVRCRSESLELVATPNLVKLGCFLMRQKVSVQKQMPHLMDVSLLRHSTDHLSPMVASISHVRTLSINILLLKGMVEDYKTDRAQSNIFPNLKELHLTVNQPLADCFLAAIHIFLGERPSIETLCIQISIRDPSAPMYSSQYDNNNKLVRESNTWKPLYQRNCKLMTGLRIARFIGLIGTKNEIKLIRFLLARAPNLFFMPLICGRRPNENLIEQISLFPKASSDACIMVTGNNVDIDLLCQSTQLYDYGAEAADYQDVCICTKHFETNPIRVKWKTIYVRASKDNQATGVKPEDSYMFHRKRNAYM